MAGRDRRAALYTSQRHLLTACVDTDDARLNEGSERDDRKAKTPGVLSIFLSTCIHDLLEERDESVQRRCAARVRLVGCIRLPACGHRSLASVAAALRERLPVLTLCCSCNAFAGPSAEGEVQLVRQTLLVRLLPLGLLRRQHVCETEDRERITPGATLLSTARVLPTSSERSWVVYAAA